MQQSRYPHVVREFLRSILDLYLARDDTLGVRCGQTLSNTYGLLVDDFHRIDALFMFTHFFEGQRVCRTLISE